jgi:high affinity Mn2+ porin
VAQAWYQLEVPFTERNVLRKTTFTVGKIDPFVFFDQNAIADDETRHFANNVFVHNPLARLGGRRGCRSLWLRAGRRLPPMKTFQRQVHALGRVPGRLWVGRGASFSGSNGKPLVIAQAWVSPRINALPGTYRAYAWSNARAAILTTAKRATAVSVSPSTSA